jgi:hypothetical protein
MSNVSATEVYLDVGLDDPYPILQFQLWQQPRLVAASL